jgi:hypothetical protein
MSVTIREFRREDRDQLTWLVNLHVGAVIPGIALSTNVVLSQLEREPLETIVDPWVAERVCLVAVQRESVVAASLLLRYRNEDDVGADFRAAAEIRWLVVDPGELDAGQLLLQTSIGLMRAWSPSHIYADGALPAPGCYGIPDSWPHVRRLVVDAGFEGPARVELVLLARCDRLTGNQLEDTTVVRSVGRLGTRLDIMRSGGSLGYIEVGEMSSSISRSTTALAWTDIGNLFPAKHSEPTTVIPALLSAAADWLLLGGVERLIDYYAEDADPSGYLAALLGGGFAQLSRNERGWELAVT